MTPKSPEAKARARRRRLQWYYEHRGEQLEKMKKYHKATYAQRRDRKNAQTRERRKATNWYEANREELLANRKAYYQSHKGDERVRGRARHAALRMEVLQHYGGQCACCGETEPRFLGIDHINGGGSAHRKTIGLSGKSIYYWLKNNGFPAGFQVLCHNCNSAKGRYGICPHQRGNE